MPLSEEELRLLEQMERALVEEDPRLASTLRGTKFAHAARRRAILGGCVVVLGLVLLVAAVLTEPLLGVVGFVVMLGGALLVVTATRAPTAPMGRQVRDSGRSGLGVVDGGRRHKTRNKSRGDFMARMEERWRSRRGRGF